MAPLIHLVRYGSILPFIDWMNANGRPIDSVLREVDLTYASHLGANQPIPFRQALDFMRAVSRGNEPDLPCRVVSNSGVAALGFIGKVALGAPTVGEAIKRVAIQLPNQVPHSIMTASETAKGVTLREVWGIRMDDTTRHMLNQYVAALIQSLCIHGGATKPVFSRIAMVPHPAFGFSNLPSWFGQQIEVSSDKALKLVIPPNVAALPLQFEDINTLEVAPPSLRLQPLIEEEPTASIRIVMAAMFSEAPPTLERLSKVAGVGVRTLQRRIQRAGTTYSELLESVRRDVALQGLAKGERPIREIADMIGYKQQSSLSRAVRRWSGTTPKRVSKRPEP